MAKRCPACKKGNLILFDDSPTVSTFTCTICDKLITVKTSFGKIIEVAIPGVTVITGGIAILHFLGVENVSDLISTITDNV